MSSLVLQRIALALVAVGAVLAVVVALSSGDGAESRVTITVLWTNDFHGAIAPRDLDDGRPIGSTPVLAAYLERERAKNPERTILLDGGDCMQGSMPSNLSFGRAVIEQMNRLGYSASAIGNHEFDWSVDTLAARIAESDFPWLGANVYLRGADRRPDWATESILLERDGVRIGVVGFATVSTPEVTMPSYVAGLRFRATATIAQRAIDSLRARGADIVLVTGHLPSRPARAGSPVRGELVDLAKAVHGENAVLGGHSHVRVEEEIDGVPILIAWSHGRAIGRIDFTFDRRTRRVVDHDARLILTYADEIQPHPGFAAFADSLDRALRPLAGRVLCEAPRALMRRRDGESRLGDWVADVMRREVSADVALHNPGGLRADLNAGPVTVEDVFNVMPFDNRLVTLQMTGASLLGAIEHGLRTRGCLQISGLRYRFDPERPAGERVLALSHPDGSPIVHGRVYTVATNEFLADGGDGYWMIEGGANRVVTETLVRDAMLEDCAARGRRGEPLAPELDGRIVRIESAPSPTR